MSEREGKVDREGIERRRRERERGERKRERG